MKFNYDMLFLLGVLIIGLFLASFLGIKEGLTGNSASASSLPTINEITGGTNTNPQNKYDNLI